LDFNLRPKCVSLLLILIDSLPRRLVVRAKEQLLNIFPYIHHIMKRAKIETSHTVILIISRHRFHETTVYRL